MPKGSTCSVAKRRATSATAPQSSLEAALNETSIRRHTYESAIEGPAAPWIANAVLRMVTSVRHSNKIGLIAGVSPRSSTSGLAGCAFGCLASRLLRTSGVKSRIPPLLYSVMREMAAELINSFTGVRNHWRISTGHAFLASFNRNTARKRYRYCQGYNGF